MESATRVANSLTRGGLAYIEFAHQNRGLFRLMFGPVLAERAKYPALQAATAGVEAVLLRGVADLDQRRLDDNHAAMAAWGLVHGLAHLIVDGFFPAARAMVQAEEILAKSDCRDRRLRSRPESSINRPASPAADAAAGLVGRRGNWEPVADGLRSAHSPRKICPRKTKLKGLKPN